MLTRLLTTLWADETGSVIAAEYLMLGTVVGLGGVTGLAAMRDAMTSEMGEYGRSVRELRQSYSVPALHGQNASAGGSAAADQYGAYNPNAPHPQQQAAQHGVTFSVP